MAIDISGTEVILSDLEKLLPSDANLDNALTAGAQIIAEDMRVRAPALSGKMKGAINVGPPKNTSRGRTVTAGIHRRDFQGEEDYYPSFVEYGHGGPHPAPPHPFIRPAYDAKKDEAWAAVKQAVIDELNAKGV